MVAHRSPSDSQPDQPQRLRIGLFTETFLPKIDGVVNILQLLLRYLASEGHEAILFAPSGGPSEFAGFRVVPVNGITAPYYTELKFNFPRSDSFRTLHRFQPDLVHVLHPFVLGPFGMRMARRLGVPVLASYHTDIARYAAFYGQGFLTGFLRRYATYLHNQATLTVCPSSVLRDDLRRQGIRRVRWWRRGIDTDLFSAGPVDPKVREELTQGHPDDFLVLNVGRHAPEKGLFGLRDRLFPMEGLRLAFVGDGPSHAELRAWYAGTPTAFTGYRYGEDLVAAYRAADLFVFPSTTETFGLVALEAMACRLPVIAARRGGITDTVAHNHNGLLFDPENPGEIREQVRQMKDNRSLLQSFAEAGWQHALRQDWRSTMDQLVGFYRMALRQHGIFG